METIPLVPKNEIGACLSTHGFEYEAKVTVYTALSAALFFDKFELYTNVKDFEPLDDIYLKGYKGKEETLYLVQLKHVANEKKLEDNFFIKENVKPKFDLIKFNNKYMELSTNLRNINFIFYTNYKLDVESSLFIKNESLENAFINSLNTSTEQESFLLNKRHDKLMSLNLDFLNNTSFLTNQQNVDDIDNSIIKLLINKFEISEDLSHLLIDKLLYYFDNICGETEIKPIITKSLTLQLLYFSGLYCRSIIMSTVINRNSNFQYSPHLWNYLKKNKIIIKKEQVDSVQNMIFNHDSLNQNVDVVYMNIMFKHKKFGFKGTKNYFVQCFRALLPLLIETKYYREVTKILNKQNQFQVIFIDENNLKYLETKFNNVTSELYEEIFKMKIYPKNRKECFIKDIFKNKDELKLMLNNVNVSDFLQVCKNDQSRNEMKGVELDRFVYWLKVKNSLDDLIRKDTVVLINYSYSKQDLINYYKLKIKEGLINIVHETLEIKSNSKIIILNDKYYNQLNINEIKNYYRNVHFLKIGHKNSLFWVNTFGSFENIKFDETNKDTLELKSVPEIFKFSKIIVFSGIPGIGKTIAMNQLSTFISSDIYVILIKLTEKQNILDNLADNLNCLDIIKLLSNEKNSFYSNIFELKFKQKDLCIIFDGYDEIAPKFVETTNKLIKCIINQEIQVILTTRTILQKEIEKEFSTKSFTLKPFDLKEQTHYLEQYFSQNSTRDKYFIENMCAGIINKIGDVEFNSVPLHLKIICDLLLDLFTENKFDISSIESDKIKIYKLFIDNKINVFKEKTKTLNFDEAEVMKYHQSFAVKKIFPDYIDSTIQEYLNIFSQKIKNGSEKTGFLVDDANEIFIHRTIAEYFTASWLLDNYNNNSFCKNIIITEIFKRKYYFVNWCFNSLLYNETSVYNKIISNQFNEITFDEINQEYALNRNILHLVILNFDLNNKSKIISSSLENFFRKLNFEEIDFVTHRDYFELTPFDYLEKIVKTIELIITINVEKNNLYFHFNQNFSFIEFLSCKNIKVYNSQIKFNNGFDLLIFTTDKENFSKFKFIFLMENYDKENKARLLEVYKIGFQWLIELGESINYLHYKAMDINSLHLSNFLLEKYDSNDFFININDNPLSYALLNNLQDFIEFFIKSDTVIRYNYKNIIYILKKFIKDIILNNNENLINFLITNNFILKELEVYNELKKNPEILEIYKNLLTNQINDKVGNKILHLIILNKNNIKYTQNEIQNSIFLEILKHVIKIKNGVNTQNKNGETPLYLAIQNNDLETVKILIANKANINFGNNPQKSYLHSSISSKNLEITKILLESEANLEFLDINGDTPLIFAVKNQNLESVKILLDNKANIEAIDIDGNTSLIWAVNNENIEVVKILLNFGAKIDTSSKKQQTPLHHAVLKKDLEITKILLKKTEHIEAVDIYGDTPLIWAVRNENLDAVKLLINFGAQINKCSNYHSTPLNIAAKFNKETTITKILLKNHAYIENRNLEGDTPLLGAVLGQNLETLKLLIQFGAEINVQNKLLKTPLHIAVEKNCLEILKVLLENKAELDFFDENGQTPLSLAQIYNNEEIISLLSNNCQNI